MLLDIKLGACGHLLAHRSDRAGHRHDETHIDSVLRSNSPGCKHDGSARRESTDETVAHGSLAATKYEPITVFDELAGGHSFILQNWPDLNGMAQVRLGGGHSSGRT